MTIPCTCNNCGEYYTLKDKLAGKNVRCLDCKQIFRVPVPVNAAAEAIPTHKQCPNCDNKLSTEAVLCVQCGFDLRSGQKIETKVTPRQRRNSPITYLKEPPSVVLRGIIFGCFAMLLLLALVLAVAEFARQAAPAWEILLGILLVLASLILLALPLGTSRWHGIMRNYKGSAALAVFWRVCFVPLPPKIRSLKPYDAIIVDSRGTGAGLWLALELVIVLGLLTVMFFVCNPLIFWLAVATSLGKLGQTLKGQTGHYVISFANTEAGPRSKPVVVYRASKEEDFRRVLNLLTKLTKLPVSRG